MGRLASCLWRRAGREGTLGLKHVSALIRLLLFFFFLGSMCPAWCLWLLAVITVWWTVQSGHSGWPSSKSSWRNPSLCCFKGAISLKRRTLRSKEVSLNCYTLGISLFLPLLFFSISNSMTDFFSSFNMSGPGIISQPRVVRHCRPVQLQEGLLEKVCVCHKLKGSLWRSWGFLPFNMVSEFL